MDFIRNTNNDPVPDEALVQQYRDGGDLNILACLYQRYMDLVYGVCLKYLNDPEKSRDAVMNIFEELIHKLRTNKVDHFRSWLYVLSRNHCLMQLRSPRNLKTIEFDPLFMQNSVSWHPDGVLEKEELLNKLQTCLEKLAAEQKQTVRLFYLEQKSYKEIAAITGIEWNSVRSYIQNGRRNLKICMEEG